jgi:hypothetical protein
MYFDKEGELTVIPIYKQLKYWLLIIAIIVIFLGLMHQGPKSRPISLPTRSKTPHSNHKQLKHEKSIS